MPSRRRTWALACLLLGGAGCTAGVDEVPMPYFDVVVTCDTFCSAVLRHCRGVAQMYASPQDCHSSCAAWPNHPRATATARGNSIQCRMVYATMAAHMHDTLEFCQNAGAAGGEMCRDD